MTKDEVLKLALEALHGFIPYLPLNDEAQCGRYDKAITAIKEALAQPEQEAVAWLHTKIEGVAVPHRPADLDKHPDRWEALYKTPSPCPTCEALARTVMLDQTSYDTTPPQRKPLTENEIKHLWYEACQTNLELTSQLIVHLARNIEAAHGIKGEA